MTLTRSQTRQNHSEILGNIDLGLIAIITRKTNTSNLAANVPKHSNNRKEAEDAASCGRSLPQREMVRHAAWQWHFSPRLRHHLTFCNQTWGCTKGLSRASNHSPNTIIVAPVAKVCRRVTV